MSALLTATRGIKLAELILAFAAALALLSAGIAVEPVPEDTVVVFGFTPLAANFGVMGDLALSADGRVFAVQRTGIIHIVLSDGTVLGTPFLDIRSKVSSDQERGLVALSFHPQYASNGLFYVNYTDLAGDTLIAQYQVSSSDPNLADPSSEVSLLAIPQPYGNHNGADLLFGPDGYLYVGMGDGGGIGDPGNNAQDGQTLLGAILRLDVSAGAPYTIPADNPYVGEPGIRDEIWALGLRNPWRPVFDWPSGEFYIVDVGHARWEELNVEPPGFGGGANYGWRCYEGHEPFNLVGCRLPSDYRFPELAIGRSELCAAIGGHVYRGSQHPAMFGHFLVADYCSGRVYGYMRDPLGKWRLESVGLAPVRWVTTFGEGPTGELYLAGSGQIFKVAAATVKLTPEISFPIVLAP